LSDRQTHRSIDPPNTSRSTAAYTSERDPQTPRSIDPPEIIRRWPYTDNLDTCYIIRDAHLYFTYEELGFYSPQFNAKVTRGRSPISGQLIGIIPSWKPTNRTPQLYRRAYPGRFGRAQTALHTLSVISTLALRSYWTSCRMMRRSLDVMRVNSSLSIASCANNVRQS